MACAAEPVELITAPLYQQPDHPDPATHEVLTKSQWCVLTMRQQRARLKPDSHVQRSPSASSDLRSPVAPVVRELLGSTTVHLK